MRSQLGDLLSINGIRGIVRYVGARGHLGVDMADGTFRVVKVGDEGVRPL